MIIFDKALLLQKLFHEYTEKRPISRKNRGGCVAALVCFTGVESASALDFTFSFDNTNGNVGGTVEGIIGGLNDNSTGAATSLRFTSFPAGLGTLFFGTDRFISTNQFTVTNGSITAADFAAGSSNFGLCINNSANCFGGFGSAPVGITNALTFNGANDVVSNSDGFGGVTFAAVPFEFSPTLGLLLVAGLFGGNHLYRKHKAEKLVFGSEE